MPSHLINIAIIGCGNIGATHLKGLSAMAGVNIAALCDAHIDAARALGSLAPQAAISDDIERVLINPDLHAVVIATHNDSHVPIALKSIASGKAVLMEKPMALDLDSAVRLAREVETRKVPFMMGFKLRFEPAVARARAFLPSPMLTVGHLHDSPWPEDGWFMDPERGGGNILSQGCHMGDLVCYLNSSAPVRVHAEGGNLQHPASPLYDNIACTIRFANNSVASLIVGDSGPAPVISKFSALMTANNRAVLIHDRMKAAAFFENQRAWEERTGSEQGFEREDEAFIEALRNSRPMPCGHRDGLLSVLLLDRVWKSIRTGAPQSIPSIEEVLTPRATIVVTRDAMPLRVGLVGGMPASHCKVFSSILNGPAEGETFPEGWPRLPAQDFGLRITSVWDPDLEAAQKHARVFGIEQVSGSLEEMAANVDAAIICDDRSFEHARRAEPFLRAGLPVYVDKIFGRNAASSSAIVKIAKDHHARVFAASGLRFSREVQEARAAIERIGPVRLLQLTGPGDLVWYGIHLMEVAFPLLGSEVESVINTGAGPHNIIRARYRDGADLLVNVSEKFAYTFHCLITGEKGTHHTTISDSAYYYTGTMEAAARMFHGGPPPVDPEESLGIMRFLDAAAESKTRNGEWITL